MRNYEIIFLIYPSETINIVSIINYYSEIIVSNNGKIHRLENWGLRYLAYSIKNLRKAYYILMNVEISVFLVKKLEKNFNINDKIVRFLIIKKTKPEFGLSPFMLKKKVI